MQFWPDIAVCTLYVLFFRSRSWFCMLRVLEVSGGNVHKVKYKWSLQLYRLTVEKMDELKIKFFVGGTLCVTTVTNVDIICFGFRIPRYFPSPSCNFHTLNVLHLPNVTAGEWVGVWCTFAACLGIIQKFSRKSVSWNVNFFAVSRGSSFGRIKSCHILGYRIFWKHTKLETKSILLSVESIDW